MIGPTIAAVILVEPSVGIFWQVTDDRGRPALLTDRTALASAEPYGECLTHPYGHYEVWERWRNAPARAKPKDAITRAITVHEYEDFPRGRIVYHQPSARFWIYADKRLQKSQVLNELRGAFGLAEAECEVRSDPHYRS